MTDLFQQTDQPVNEREELLNKWKDKSPEELLAAKVESDLYIRTLEKQKDELREDFIRAQQDNQTRANLQDLVDRLNNQQLPEPTKKPEENTAQFDPKVVEDLVLKKIEENKLREKESQNYTQVQNKLKDRFGNNAVSILREQASTIGLSEEEVNNLARKSPEAFFRVMGLSETPRQDSISPPRSEQRSDHFAPRSVKRTYTFYQDMKAKNPKLYWDPKTQVQMHKDGEAMGVSFFDDGEAVTHFYS